MPIYRHPLALLIFLFSFAFVKAQKNNPEIFRTDEDSCVYYYKQISSDIPDTEKNVRNNIFSNKLRQFLETPGSFGYPLDSLKSIGRLYAPDKSFRIITWNLLLNDVTYKYFGFIQIAKSNKIFELVDRSNEITDPENSVLSAGKWYGCLYYKMLKEKVYDRTYYTLLAIQYHNFNITRKMIDILFFDEYGNPVFGAPIIQTGNKFKHRLVFEYSALAAVNLKYDDKLKMIIFDHLAPAEEKYVGQTDYYGPDLTFDGLFFKKDKWIYKANLDLRQSSDPSPRHKPLR
jgi:hypothetical protein